MSFEKLLKVQAEYKRKFLGACLWSGGGFGIVLLVTVVVYALNAQAGTEAVAIGILMILLMGVTLGALAVWAIVSLITRKERIAYRRGYKAHFVAEALARVFTDVQYSHERELGMSQEVLRRAGVLASDDLYSSNDFVSARYKGLLFTQADVKVQQVRVDSEGHTRYDTVFKGRWMKFGLRKKFDFRMMVVGRRFDRSLLRNRKGLRKVKLESQEFNREFKVYAQDGFETFYLLDPGFMASAMALSQKYKGKVLLVFVDKELQIAVNDGKDVFEPPMPWKKLDERAEFEKVVGEITMVTDVVDSLKLDR